MEGIEAALFWELNDIAIAVSMVFDSREIVAGNRGYAKERLERERKAFINEAYPTIGPITAITRKVLTGVYLHNGIGGKPSRV